MLEEFSISSLNETIDEATLIRHELNHPKEHIDLKFDVQTWKQVPPWADKTWKQFKSHSTKAINNNKSDTAIGTADVVKEQVDQNKENQHILAQATGEANDKTNLLELQATLIYVLSRAEALFPQSAWI